MVYCTCCHALRLCLVPRLLYTGSDPGSLRGVWRALTLFFYIGCLYIHLLLTMVSGQKFLQAYNATTLYRTASSHQKQRVQTLSSCIRTTVIPPVLRIPRACRTHLRNAALHAARTCVRARLARIAVPWRCARAPRGHVCFKPDLRLYLPTTVFYSSSPPATMRTCFVVALHLLFSVIRSLTLYLILLPAAFYFSVGSVQLWRFCVYSSDYGSLISSGSSWRACGVKRLGQKEKQNKAGDRRHARHG